MNSKWKNIAKNLLDGKDPNTITAEDIAKKMEEYPYYAVLPFLKTLLLKNKEQHQSIESSAHASLYFQNPIWFTHQLKHANIEPNEPLPAIIGKEMDPETITELDEFIFEPLHTVDYFASQGIKEPQSTSTNDQFSAKLKSFTEWLKTMKKINPEQINPTLNQTDEQVIRDKAEASNIVHEVYSETLAEVYEKQGLEQKAIEVYKKLSLLDPTKSAYFADRIAKIKRN